MARISSFCDRNVLVLLGWVLCFALILRALALFSMNHSLYGDFLLWDERTYDEWARAIVHGRPYGVYDQSSLPAYVMALVYRVTGPAPAHVRMLNVGLSVLTCGFIFGIGRELGGNLVGLLAAVFAALYQPFVFFAVTLLKESLGLCLFSAVVYLYLAADRAGLESTADGHASGVYRRWYILLVLFGAAAALTANVRQNALLVLLVLALVLLHRAFKIARHYWHAVGAVLCLAIGLLAAAPLALQTYRETGAFSPTPVGGFNLYLGNDPTHAAPYYRPARFATAVPREQGIGFTIEASRRVGRRLSAGEASQYWTQQVLALAAAEPAAFFHKLGVKALAVLNRFEEGDNHHIGFISQFVPFFRLPLLSYWLLMPLGASALLLDARRERHARVLGTVLALYALTLVLVYTNLRTRAPMLVLLIPYAARGLVQLASAWRSRSERALLALGALGLTGIAALPIPGSGDLTAHYNAHAMNLQWRGKSAEAARYLRESAGLKGAYSDYATLGLAFDDLGRSDVARAIERVGSISDASFAAAPKYELLGDAWRQLGEQGKAQEAYEHALSINFGIRDTRRKLIELYDATGSPRAEEERHIQGYVDSFFHPGNRSPAFAGPK